MPLLLQKSLYGLRESGKNWWLTVDEFLREQGFKACDADPCLYTKTTPNGDRMTVLVYVDDMLYSSTSDEMREEFDASIQQRFTVKLLGKATHYLGLRIRVGEDGSIFLDQQSKIESFLETNGFYNTVENIELTPPSTHQTPHLVSTKLSKEQEPSTVEEREALLSNRRTARLEYYRNILGGLIYFSIGTRPDISHAVSQVARYAANPGREHLMALEKICNYLKARPQKGILYKRTGESDDELHAFSDASWAEDVDSRRSTTGYITRMCGGAVSWNSKRQKSVATSTMEAEYVAAAEAVKEIIYVRQLVQHLGNPLKQPTVLFQDNQAALAAASHSTVNSRAKHIDIAYHFMRERCNPDRDQLFVVQNKHIGTKDQRADIFTKAFGAEGFEHVCNHVVENPPSSDISGKTLPAIHGN
jgi:hypothetical protein